MTATVIVPTIGSSETKEALESVFNQTYKTKTYLVIDGSDYVDKVDEVLYHMDLTNSKLNVCNLPSNVGANGFYGHRIYAAFTHLINTDYVLYLDPDCWIEPNHVESLINLIERNNLDWAYSLRNVCDKDGNFICKDDCESLGKWAPYTNYNLVDTNCYCIKTSIATKVASLWHGGWGTDRLFFNTLAQHFSNFSCTGEYTLNYRLGGNDGSVKKEFFLNGNKEVEKKYNGELPWKKY